MLALVLVLLHLGSALVAVCDVAPGWYQVPVLLIHLRLAAFVSQNPVVAAAGAAVLLSPSPQFLSAAAAPAAVSLRCELEPQYSHTPQGLPAQRHPVGKINIKWVKFTCTTAC